MKYLLIYLTVVGIGIGIDLFRFVFAKLLKFEIEELSIFMGPKLASIDSYTTRYIIKIIPYGSYVKFKESFLNKSRASRLILGYLPEILLLTSAFIFIKYKINYVLFISGILLLVLNGFSMVFSIIFDTRHVFYRYKKDINI